jgi:hypothetical protein
MKRAWIVVVVLAFTAGARAQFFGGDFNVAYGGYEYDQWALPATAEEAEALCTDAGLGADGLAAAKALVESCQATLQRDQRRMQRALERAWLTHKPEENAAVQEISQKEMEKRTASHDEAERALLDDLKSILPKGSDEAWAAFERRRHRRLYLHQDWKTGVGVDLVEVAKTEKIDTIPAVREVLGAYEVELDRLLMARVPVIAVYEKKMEKAGEDKDAAEKAYNEMRDVDCGILHFQRESGKKLMAAAPEEKRGALRDRLLTARSPGVQTKTRLLDAAEKLIKSGRLEEKKKKELQEAVRNFYDRSRALDEKNLTASEDRECGQTYAQSNNPEQDETMQTWVEDGRKLQADLLAAVDKAATDEDLDAVTGP